MADNKSQGGLIRFLNDRGIDCSLSLSLSLWLCVYLPLSPSVLCLPTSLSPHVLFLLVWYPLVVFFLFLGGGGGRGGESIICNNNLFDYNWKQHEKKS